MVPIVASIARVATDGLGVEFTGLCVVSLLVGLVPSQSECFCHSGVFVCMRERERGREKKRKRKRQRDSQRRSENGRYERSRARKRRASRRLNLCPALDGWCRTPWALRLPSFVTYTSTSVPFSQPLVGIYNRPQNPHRISRSRAQELALARCSHAYTTAHFYSDCKTGSESNSH